MRIAMFVGLLGVLLLPLEVRADVGGGKLYVVCPGMVSDDTHEYSTYHPYALQWTIEGEEADLPFDLPLIGNIGTAITFRHYSEYYDGARVTDEEMAEIKALCGLDFPKEEINKQIDRIADTENRDGSKERSAVLVAPAYDDVIPDLEAYYDESNREFPRCSKPSIEIINGWVVTHHNKSTLLCRGENTAVIVGGAISISSLVIAGLSLRLVTRR